MPDERVALLLDPATRRLVRTVDAMTPEQWAGDSLLPGWSRAHVVAHLTLNAESLARALEGVHEGRRTPMYPSDEARDGDIAALAGAPVSDLRTRFLASTTVVGQWIADLAENLEDASIERVPGGRMFLAGEVGDMRLREVEVHHADLGLDYTFADWPEEFAAHLLDAREATWGRDHGFTVHATDLDQRWTFGGPGDGTGPTGPTVSGPARDLAWWAGGRGAPDTLSGDGPLPDVPAW